jgi:Leucine-rich repeat (LRR) protein
LEYNTNLSNINALGDLYALTYLSCFNAGLTELNLFGCTNFKYLFCQENQLTSLTLTTTAAALTELNCSNTGLTT